MGRELWERVSVDKINVGDMVLSSDLKAIVEWSESAADMAKAYPHHYHYPKLRRVDPADDPRVLRRALELCVRFIWTVDEEFETNPESWIDQARRELESEASDDQA